LKQTIKNYSASVRSRLENAAKESRRGFSEVLLFYSMERFLFRLAQIPEGSSFVLKGGAMFRVWDAAVPRPTRDLDLLSSSTNDMNELTRIMASACSVSLEEDGIIFDPKSIRAEKIKEDADYEGVRIKLEGKLGTAKTPLQIDIGFGDVVIPRPLVIDYPTIIDLPTPKLKTYTKESVIAEKLHAMVFLGSINSRMKDFYDVWFLASHFDFEGKTLAEAIKQTFKRRKTDIEFDPIAFRPDFASSAQKKIQWDSFYRKLQTNVPENQAIELPDALTVVKALTVPPMVALVEQKAFAGRWHHSTAKWSQ